MHVKNRVEPIFGCGIAGILQATSGIESVVPIVHGPMSCASGHRIIPLYANKEPLVATTSLTELDLIMGSEERLKDAIVKAESIYHPKLIIVILTCATSLTGEISKSIISNLSKKIDCPIIVGDGSGIIVDELVGYKQFYKQIRDLVAPWETENPFSEDCELAGISISDFNSTQDIHTIKELLKFSMNTTVRRTLFHSVDLNKKEWRHLHTLNIGRLWLDSTNPCPAPIGITGTEKWTEYAAQELGKSIEPEFHSLVESTQALIERKKENGDFLNLRVGIEAASWWGIGLAKFLNEELGCDVILSSDIEAKKYQDTFGDFSTLVIDTGGTELTDVLRSFRVNVMFGSSYSKSDEWAWIPFWQPVWHVIDDQSSLMGIEGALNIVDILVSARKQIKN